MNDFIHNLPPGVLLGDEDQPLELTDIDRDEWKEDVENDDRAMLSEFYPEKL